MYDIVTIHSTSKCNLDCSFCYSNNCKNELPNKTFLDMVKYLPEITSHVAIGGGELLYKDTEFAKQFGVECFRNGISCGLTTNGKQSSLSILPYYDTVAVSLDTEKWESLDEFLSVVTSNHDVNLLVEEVSKNLIEVVDKIINRVNRVILLSPKYMKTPINSNVDIINYILFKHRDVYVDDCLSQILKHKSFEWDTPCHYGKIASIHPDGSVRGCSFAQQEESKMFIKNPKDVLKIKDLEFEERYSCPYLVV